MSFKEALSKVIQYHDLDIDQAKAAMDVIMQGEATPAQIGSYLTALRMKGETVDEIAGSARSMRAHVVRVNVPLESGSILVDTCGTGGDGKHTFNISTTAAFVVAGNGVKVAKHGNRAASSKCGSADLLLALGGNLDLTPEQVGECIQEVGIGFLYAINHHPAMRHAIGPRRELGQRTVFNLLGPLTNPAGATHQLVGIYDGQLTDTVARVLGALGTKAAFVVHGADGLDELSTTGPNKISRLEEGRVTTFEMDPLDYGLPRATLADFLGADPEKNALITRNILSGQDRGPKRDIVLLNAAAALCLDGRIWESGLAEAKKSLDSGAALQVLDTWIEKTIGYRA